MESDSKNINENLEKTILRKPSNNLHDGGDVSKPFGVRYPFLFGSTINQFLLDYNFNFLPWCSVFCWIIFLL
jgi:hypothetical protein